ncbi:HPr family phosphocarrier protein [Sphaerobacter sp.]|uniref:HPr family phosphocarrier protein n=1 Tax=Sphaerobacter sp. TaxID=2099654 RepID=UPI001D4F615C|nr:HPr family phosphocarrier protein [Sphaerobacter sp.]MBX5445818.1 HPr family phosphocarrier protein [Sphaerobacter sp.]
MTEARLTIANPVGLHARPAALFVRTAASFQSAVRVRNLTRDPEREADAKSILSLMTLGVEHGHEILIRADGPDEEAAIATLRELVESNFRE